MSQDTPNPFALPGMSAAFMNTPNNPLLTSMDMMRQAMSNMGYGAKSSSTDTMVNPMAPEELEKRIGELRVVENWLKLNLSMLSSSIQGMEVQLATVKTLQSFVAMGQSATPEASAQPSPLEVALGLKPAPKNTAAKQSTSASTTASETQAKPQPNSQAQAPATSANPQQAAAEGWWNMLENQFAQIAAATANAAKMSNEAMQATAAKATKAAADSAPKKAAATKSRPAKKASKTARTPKKEA